MTTRAWRIGLPVLVGAAAVAAIVIVANGGSGSEPSGASPPSGKASSSVPKGLPKPLADNAEQANDLVDGGSEALEAKLAELDGHPVVVNQWGSWCPPCRAEFPFFAESAQAHLGDVAFLGVDIQDDRGAAEDFLAELPTPYPHVFDRDAEAVDALEWGGVSPTTWLIDQRGEVIHQRPGAYASHEDLEADIDRFLLRR